MDTKDLARLAPLDGAVALRSLPRRFRAALRPIDDPDVEAWAEQVSSTGHAPIDHLVDADRSLTFLRQGLEQVLHHDRPALPPATLDPSAREWPEVRADLDGELELLSATVDGFATLVERVPAPDWGRPATVAGSGAEVTALDVLREAVRTGVTDLRLAEQAFEENRRRS